MAYKLTASEALSRIQAGDLTIEQYAQSLLDYIGKRDGDVKAWAYLDPEQVLEQARALDKVPREERGPLHGLPLGIKDVLYTKDMPTEHNSSIYKGSFPKIDAGSVMTLRHAGALIFGKLTTTEFAAVTTGTNTCNPHDLTRTAGGSSSGSGAAVGDSQIPFALGTQTGGSTIRPASFNGIYALKPTWNAITREGQRIYSLVFDVLGLFARCTDDIELLADALNLRDDEKSTWTGVAGSRFALCKTVVWPKAGPGTRDALAKAAELLRAHGAIVDDIDLPAEFDPLPEWHRIVLNGDGRTAFLPEHRVAKDKLFPALAAYIDRPEDVTRKQYLEALDGMAALRPKIDRIASEYAAILTPSVPDEAPVGFETTGSAAFCDTWSALHTPVVNIPGFKGPNGMPVGVSLVAPRFHDRHLLKVSKDVGKIFEAEGGWQRPAK